MINLAEKQTADHGEAAWVHCWSIAATDSSVLRFHVNFQNRVARWFVFKPKIPI
jgi:hypothetical protein